MDMEETDMGFGYMITLWGREGTFIPHCWEGIHRNKEDYTKVDTGDPKKPLFYFRKPVRDLMEDISEEGDRVTVICMDENAKKLFEGLTEYKGIVVIPVSKEEIEEPVVGDSS